MTEIDLPTNQMHCDPELAGCGTSFSITLDRCPHCQLNWGTEEEFDGPDDLDEIEFTEQLDDPPL